MENLKNQTGQYFTGGAHAQAAQIQPDFAPQERLQTQEWPQPQQAQAQEAPYNSASAEDCRGGGGDRGENSNLVYISADSCQFALTKALYFNGFFARTKLTPAAKLLVYGLVQHYNPANPDFYPSQRYLSSQLGVSEKTIERAVKELVANKLLTYVTQGVNHYKFTRLFFDSVKMSAPPRQNVGAPHRQNVGQTNNTEKIINNKKGFYNFSEGQSPDGGSVSAVSVQQDAQKTDPRGASLAPKPSAEQAPGMDYGCAGEAGANARGASSGSVGASAYSGAGFAGAHGYGNPQPRSGNFYKKSYPYAKNARQQGAFGKPAFENSGGRAVPSTRDTAVYLEKVRRDKLSACSPLDFSREQAVEWLEKLPPLLHKSAFAVKLRQKFALELPAHVREYLVDNGLVGKDYR